jgi:hypothetical protein
MTGLGPVTRRLLLNDADQNQPISKRPEGRLHIHGCQASEPLRSAIFLSRWGRSNVRPIDMQQEGDRARGSPWGGEFQDCLVRSRGMIWRHEL